jgi:hypothetical protein
MFLIFLAGCNAPQGLREVLLNELTVKTDAQGMTAEQANIKKRVELSSDPNGIWWIYCLSDTGQPVFYGAVKGKVTSSWKNLGELSNGQNADGTYGNSDSYVYWFDPAGVYYQWDGKYFLTSREIKLANPVLNFRGVK